MFEDFKTDARSKKGGWAPGGYTCKCWKCNGGFFGAKRSNECADCAYKHTEEFEELDAHNTIKQAAKDYDMSVEEVIRECGGDHTIDDFYEKLEAFIKHRAEQLVNY
jgi:hypothetical protein